MKQKIKVAICLVLLVVAGSVLTIEYKKYYTVEGKQKMAMEASSIAFNQEQVKFKPIVLSIDQNIHEFRKAFCGYSKEMLEKYYKNNDGIWQKNERLQSKRVIEQKKYDYIVLPVQDFSLKNDTIGKLLGAEYLARKINLATEASVMPPELFTRLFGERMYVYDDNEVYDLAKKTGAKVVHLFLVNSSTFAIGDKKERPEKRLGVVLTDTERIVKDFHVYELKNATEEEALDAQLFAISDDIAKRLTGKVPLPITAVKSVQGETWALQGTADEILTNLKSSIDHAAYFQLLALLTPHLFDDERTYLFERSLVILQEMDQTSRHYNLLKARAFSHLHRRPQALVVLEGENDPAGNAMREFLNGNYYSFKEAMPNIENPLLYTLAFIEFAELSEKYEIKLPEYPSNRSDAHWKELVERAIHDNESWDRVDRGGLLAAMGEIFPEFRNYIMEDIDSQILINSLLGAKRRRIACQTDKKVRGNAGVVFSSAL